MQIWGKLQECHRVQINLMRDQDSSFGRCDEFVFFQFSHLHTTWQQRFLNHIDWCASVNRCLEEKGPFCVVKLSNLCQRTRTRTEVSSLLLVLGRLFLFPGHHSFAAGSRDPTVGSKDPATGFPKLFSFPGSS